MTIGTNVDQDNYEKFNVSRLLEDEDLNETTSKRMTRSRSKSRVESPKQELKKQKIRETSSTASPTTSNVKKRKISEPSAAQGLRSSRRLEARSSTSKTSKNNANNQTPSNVTSTKANQSSPKIKVKITAKKTRTTKKSKAKTVQERKANSRSQKKDAIFLICKMRDPTKVIGGLKVSWCDVVLSRHDKLVIILHIWCDPFFIMIEKCNSTLIFHFHILEKTL